MDPNFTSLRVLPSLHFHSAPSLLLDLTTMSSNLPTPTLKTFPTPTLALPFYFTQITAKPSAATMAVRLVGQKAQSEESEESPLLKLPVEVREALQCMFQRTH